MEFMVKHSKSYNTKAEMNNRFSNFKKNYQKIMEQNEQNQYV